MANEVRYRVIWKDASSSDTMDITQATALGANDSIKDTADMTTISVGNIVIDSVDSSNANLQGKKYSNIIDVGDKLEIYIGEGNGVPTNLLMTAYIGETDISVKSPNTIVSFKSSNKLEKLLNAFQNLAEEGVNASDVVVKVISNTNDLNKYLKMAGGLYNSQLSAKDLTGNAQTFNSAGGLTTSIATGFKSGTNGNITITIYKSVSTATFLGGNSSVVFTVNGTNKNGTTISDTITITSSDENATKATSDNFETITSITHPITNLTISDNKIVIGTGGVVPTSNSINYYSVDKKGFRVIDEISEAKYTGNGAYLYYLTNQDVVIWKPKLANATSTIAKGENAEWGNSYSDYIPAIDMRVRRGSWDLINRVVLIMGEDFDGTKILAYGNDAQSILTVGWKEQSFVVESIANKIKEEHPVPSSYPGTWGPDSTAVADLAAVNVLLKSLLKTKGEEIIRDVLDKNGLARYKVDCMMEYTDSSFNSLFKGRLIKILNNDVSTKGIPWSFGKEKLLRISVVNYVISMKNVIMKIELIEDVETAIAQYDLEEYTS